MAEGRPPRVEAYSFGEIIIDGKRYTSDVIIRPDGVLANWWRKEGHRLHLEDLDKALEVGPEVLVIGTGYSGLMEVPEELRAELEGRGIEVVVENTRRAWKIYNELASSGRKVVGAFHLTC
ncbi:hypothetical protein DRO33_02000 [Candidatus Bathyarchaeota archaeon]|nr:MAG: hypothetical protein DRO33_02000 [Candidatus Bathyarchaeota archaeon]